VSEDEDLFGKAMQEVQRIKPAAERAGGKKKARAVAHSARSPATEVKAAAPDHRPEAGEAPWHLRADGVSPEKLRRLAAGRPPVEAELDLHGMTREQMYRAMSDCLEQALAGGWRVISLVHGRGLHSEDGRPILKEAVYHWLREGPYAGWVLAAIPRPGTGGGSALLLLRRRR